jgi:hypothetical protein
VGTLFVDDANKPFRVAKYDQILPKNTSFNRRAICFTHFFQQANGYPVMAHQEASRGLSLDLAQQHIFFVGDHLQSLWASK